MGLGPYPTVSLKEARIEAEKWQAVVRTGKDAVKERERLRRDAERNMHILRDVALDAFESRKADRRKCGLSTTTPHMAAIDKSRRVNANG